MEKGKYFTKIDQIGIVLKDVKKTAKFLEKTFGIGPFLIFETSTETTKGNIGVLQLGEVQIELIQILEGKTIHTQFMDKGREGLHHLAFFVKDLEKELARLKKQGIGVVEKGEIFGYKYAYLDTEKSVGITFELVQPPENTTQSKKYKSLVRIDAMLHSSRTGTTRNSLTRPAVK